MEYAVKVNKVSMDKVKAFVTVTVNDVLVLRDIKVVEGPNGLFVSMPSRAYTDKAGNKKYSDYFFPCTQEAREKLVGAIMDAYNAAE